MEGHSRVDEPEEKEGDLRRRSPPQLESIQRIACVGTRVDEKSGIARGVRQERDDRDECERRMKAAREERVPRGSARRQEIRPEALHASSPQPEGDGKSGGKKQRAPAGLHLPSRLGWRELVVVGFTVAIGFSVGLFFCAALLPPGQLLAESSMGVLLTLAAAPLAFLAARLLRVGRFGR